MQKFRPAELILFTTLWVLIVFRLIGASPTPANLNLPLYPRLEGYRLADAFPQFDSVYAVGAHVPPGDTNRLLFCGKAGRVTIITNLATPTLTTFLDLSGKTFSESECGLLGLAFHPGWRTNRQVFVYYSTITETVTTNGLHQRLSRFLIDPDNPARALPESEVPLFTQADPDRSHQAGDLEFGPDGYLYVSVGDGGGAWDTYHNSQRIDGGFFSGILRLDVDGRPGSLLPNPHPAISPGTYWIPQDNPFIGRTSYNGLPVAPANLRTEFWAIGLRNPFRMAFNPDTGQLFANDTGQNRREEINAILPGRNYGWVLYEGTLRWPFGVPDGTEFEFPVFEYEHEGGRVAISGGTWYRGSRYPDLDGAYIFADYGGPVGALATNSTGKVGVRWIARSPGIADIAIHPATGELLFCNAVSGRVEKLTEAPAEGTSLPPLLSQTGVFADLGNLRAAPGLEPYEINQAFWSDHAEKLRWFGLMKPDHPLMFQPVAAWKSPEGAIWVKHFELPSGANTRRVETRLLVRNTNGVWGASYRWRLDQSDAELVPAAGMDEVIPVTPFQGPPTGRLQHWRYPSRDECLACHNPEAGYSLGFNTAQLNRQRAGRSQIDVFGLLGYVAGAPANHAVLPKLAELDDPSVALGFRVRSYLAANCSYCHLPGGPTRATWDASLSTPLADAGMIGVTALNNLGDVYGLTPTQIIFPGEPEQSAIYRRVADLAPYHMPPLGTSEINTNAVNLLQKWITEVLPGQETFAAWQTNHFGFPPPAAAAADADPDHDNHSNELEWLLGESPLNATRQWQLTAERRSGYLLLRFERRPGLLMIVEGGDATDTNSWQAVEAEGNEFIIPASKLQAEVKIPLSNSSSRYFRVRVTRL